MADPTDELLDRLTAHVQAHGTEEEGECELALPEARALVTRFVGAFTVPREIQDRAIIEVAADLFHRKSARNGVMDLAGGDLAPFRIARDPMKAAYPILTPFVPAGLA